MKLVETLHQIIACMSRDNSHLHVELVHAGLIWLNVQLVPDRKLSETFCTANHQICMLILENATLEVLDNPPC